jgi:hypothetical protein
MSTSSCLVVLSIDLHAVCADESAAIEISEHSRHIVRRVSLHDREWCDRIPTPEENQLYPYSEHSCAHRHSHGFGKLFGD